MKTRPFLYIFLRPVFKTLLYILYRPTTVNKEYIPKEGGCVIAGNHMNALDPILVDVCTKRVVFALAKKELHDGFFGFLFKGVGSIPVDFSKNKNHDALVSAVEYLSAGCLVNVSPEGGRNYTDEILLPFKMGAVVMARRTNVPIVPYSITGEYRLFKKGLKICFGEPLYINELEPERANEVLYEKVKELILANRENSDGSRD